MPDPSSGACRVVIAVDPGRAKCGVAVVRSGGAPAADVTYRSVVEAAEAPRIVASLYGDNAGAAIIVGNGTGSAATIRMLQADLPEATVTPVEERGTSILARQRWLDDHPPRGLRRLVPRFLRYPDAPYDDYVAVILAERWLAEATTGSSV